MLRKKRLACRHGLRRGVGAGDEWRFLTRRDAWEDWLAVLRRTALALVAAATLLVASAQSAVAAPPPTLAGQRFHVEYLFGWPDWPELTCRDNPDGTSTISFTASGSAGTGEPYPGRWTETGVVTIGGPGLYAYAIRDILDLRASFTIESSTGQVSGTKRLTAPVEDGAGVDCADSDVPIAWVTANDLSYSATITTPSGVFADRGSAWFDIERPSVHTPTMYFDQGFFRSDLSVPEQQGSILLGKRAPGASYSAMSANAKRASPFPLYFPATVRKLHAYVDGKGATSGSQTLRGVLYAHGPGGAPGALLGRTFQFTVPAGMSGRWLELYLAPPIRLNAGVYWLGLHSGTTGGVARLAWDPRDNSRRFNVDYFPDGPGNPFGSAPLDNQQLSIFASGSY
jgi:hypothetical protein